MAEKIKICPECKSKIEAGSSIQHVSKQLHQVILLASDVNRYLHGIYIFEYLLLIFSSVTPILTTCNKNANS